MSTENDEPSVVVLPAVRETGRAREHQGKSPMAVVMHRGAVISEWLAQGLTVPQAQRRAQQPPPAGLGLPRTVARRYVDAATEALVRDSLDEPAEVKRARIVAAAQATLYQANSRKRTLYERGEVVGEEPDPDGRTAVAALMLLAKLEGLA